MCAVSMISDYYRQTTDPYRSSSIPIPWSQGLPPQLPWTPEAFADLKEILWRLDGLDKKLGH